MSTSYVALPQRKRNSHIRAPSPKFADPTDSLAKLINALGVLSNDELGNSLIERDSTTQRLDAQFEFCSTRKTASFRRYLQRLEAEGQKIVVFMRGCPGSGKSTLARHIKLGGEIVSADYYFQASETRYYYDRNLCSEAHRRCFEKARQFMQLGISPLIVDNTNLTAEEMTPLALLALCYEYRVTMTEPDTPWRYDPRVLYRRNVHGVPYHKILRMLERFERGLTVKSLLAVAIRSVWDPNGMCSPPKSSFPRRRINFANGDGLWQAQFPVDNVAYAHAVNETLPCQDDGGQDRPVTPPYTRESLSDSGETHCNDTQIGTKEAEDDSGQSVTHGGYKGEDDDDPKLAEMEGRFPEVPRHLLRDLLDMCKGDLEYAIAILSESGYHHIEVPPEVLDETPQNETNQENKQRQEDELILTISSSFLCKLETLFGKLNLRVREEEASLYLPLDIDEAKFVHSLLKSINRRLRAEFINETTSSSTEGDELHFPIKILTYENDDGGPTYAAVSLKGELYTNFTMLDKDLIDSVFRHCRYNTKEAHQCLAKLLDAHHPEDRDRAHSEGECQKLDDPSCEQERPNRAREERLYRENLRKSIEAYQKKMFGAGQFYAEEARRHLRLRNYAHELDEDDEHQICLKVMDETNRLDLHGFTVASALRLLAKALKRRSNDAKKYGKFRKKLVILTGWGRHSDQNIGKLRLAVEQYLFNQSYLFRQTESGVFKVVVP